MLKYELSLTPLTVVACFQGIITLVALRAEGKTLVHCNTGW